MTIFLSGMLAIALDDFTISIFDVEMKRIVRHFSGQRGQINDMVRFCFFLSLSLSLPKGCTISELIEVQRAFILV